MQCAKCGADNKTRAKFCISCGSSMGGVCPNCGAANTTGAKFCVSCGYQFGSSVAQPVIVVKTGVPGWAWGVLGVLLAIALISGLAFSGVLPLSFAANDGSTPPPLQPVLSSPEVSTEAVYCPETGGVILYWNAGYDCSNDSGDPGYRLRYGDGFQDLNTGQFDDQASSIHIPEGWSVRLYENVEKNGASHCFNISISNFEDLGNFDNRDLPINDNVTSMQVFRDGTCGQDLAAGAEPAPMPEDESPPEGAPGTQAGRCDCNCVRELFAGLGFELEDWWDVIPIQEFNEYILDSGTAENVESGDVYGVIVLDNKNGVFDRIFSDPNLILELGYSSDEGDEDHFSTRPGEANDLVCRKINAEIVCEYLAANLFILPERYTGATLTIAYSSPGGVEREYCLSIEEEFAQPDHIFGLGGAGGAGGDEPQLDCRNYGCPSGEECVEYKQFGTFGCEPIQQQSQPSGDNQPGGSSGGCTAGCWCEIGGVWGCWQSCNSWCVDP